MSAEPIVDAEVVAEPGSGEVADAMRKRLHQELVRAEPVQLAVTPQVAASELGARLAVIQEAMKNEMVEGVDYGVIPGTDKPTLFKPGAEKLGVLFRLDVQLVNEKTWGQGDHLTVISKGTCYDAPTGARVGYGEGICTTRERKYAYRQQARKCPHCQTEAIIKGKEEYGGGWLCFKKKGGCGAKFNDGDVLIEAQAVGEIDNPDLPDLWNTVDKMAEKRARVDVILAVTGASAIFTQDAEDLAQGEAQPLEQTSAGPPYGKPVEEQQLASTRSALAYLLACAPTDNPVGYVLNEIERRAGGYLPHFTLAQIAVVAKTVKDRRDQGDASAVAGADGNPAQETSDERQEREEAERIIAETEEDLNA